MHLYLKVVWIVFSGVWGGSNRVCLILSLKGHSTHCPKIIIKKIPLRNRSAVYQADLCPGRYVPAL